MLDESYAERINESFRRSGIGDGYVDFDQFGRLQLRGSYLDEQQVDRAFSIAQSQVGIKWVSPVTPEDIKVKEWEKRLGNIFKRAAVIRPGAADGSLPGLVRARYALVVGVGSFKHGINPLQYAVRDAQSFYGFLTDPGKGNFSRQNVVMLTDQKATRANITRALDKIAEMAQPDDLVAIYISSHGTPPDKFGGVHIVTYDTEVKPREKVWHTALTEAMFRDFVENLRARRLVMVLDTCYSNGAYRSVPGFLPPGGKSLGGDEEEGFGISREYGKRLLGAKDIVIEEGRGRAREKSTGLSDTMEYGKVLISASGAGEKSWESDTLHNSIFTYFFIDGLNRHNGAVEDAFYYAKPLVYERVKKEKGRDIEQTPSAISTNAEWNMVITRRQ